MIGRSADDILSEILDKRGYSDRKAREEFLSEKPKLTYDPFLLPNVAEGTDIIFTSLSAGEKICVYGDYDVDGLMSSVLMYEFLCLAGKSLRIEPDIFWYIPSRFDEGYGLNNEALSAIRDLGADLVITVDCGSVSKNEVEFAKELGLKIVITDHHDCDPARMPDCIVIDPKAPNSEYPFKGISGCGVAFKTAHALRQRHFADNEDLRSALNRMLDLVAVATIADVVPLTDENRTLVKYGLEELNSHRRPVFAELAAAIGLSGKISSYNVAFGIAPHINAAGRMEDAKPVVELFTTDDELKRAEIISTLISHNVERRAVQERAQRECEEMANIMLPDNFFLLVKPGEMHEGVSGIVAGKLKNKYNRPCAVLSRVLDSEEGGSEPMLKGSARSIEGVDIIGMLKKHAEMFDKLGGHAMAAGFTLPAAREQELRDLLNFDMQKLISEEPDLLERKLNIEAHISSSEATLELAEGFEAFEPTGSENPGPEIVIDDASISNVRRIGSDGKHLSFSAGKLRCIMFNASDDDFGIVSDGTQLSLAGRLDINRWNGTETAQLIVDSVLK